MQRHPPSPFEGATARLPVETGAQADSFNPPVRSHGVISSLHEGCPPAEDGFLT